jgi:hypothetical protein
MKYSLTLIFVSFVQLAISQNLTFSNANLKTYLLSENSVDVNGDEIADTLIDTNNDNEIQLSKALLIQNLIISPNANSIINSIQDISQFSNLKRLTVPGDFGLIEISNLSLDSLEFIRVSDHNSIINIDLSDLPNLSSIFLEGLNGVQNLNLQNGSYASDAFSLFYTYVQYACVDSISDEYTLVSQHLINGGSINTNCSLGITDSEFKKIKIYPNPSTDKIIINRVIESVVLYNLNGQVIKEWTLPTNEIDISDLTQGIYILKIKNDNFILEQKIIKK